MKTRFTEWEMRLSGIESAVENHRTNTFTETQARGIYEEIRQHNNEAVQELNELCGKKKALHDAVLFPAIREYIAERRIDRKLDEISKIAEYDRRADALKDSVMAGQRRNYC